jgi:hypothetical protein
VVTVTVLAFDAAGNTSVPVGFRTGVPASDPTVAVVGPAAQLNQPVTVSFTPHAGVVGVTSYSYSVNGGPEQSVPAGADGTATITFLADDPAGYQVQVRSHSANGFTSIPGTAQIAVG